VRRAGRGLHVRAHRQRPAAVPGADQTDRTGGADVSRPGQLLEQHLAFALDGQLVTVASIDFKQYPDGITGGGGADIRLTSRSAKDVAAELRRDALPLSLRVLAVTAAP
jgi:preprotein translocase subunit SecD